MPSHSKKHLVIAGPGLFLLTSFSSYYGGLEAPAAITLGLALWCALWWMTEAVALAATSMLPLCILPLAGVLTNKDVANAYGHPMILLLLGGFMLSKAMEKSGSHRRIALYLIHSIRGRACTENEKHISSARILAGFMLASGLLSMWISNTATTLMLLPVALAVLDKNTDPKLPAALLLGIAYAASVGGIGTPIGTPPNLVFRSVYEDATGIEVSFSTWMMWALPVVICFIPLIWLWLRRGLARENPLEVPHPGPWRSEEVRVLCIFAITALLWITRKEPFGGWSHWLDMPGAHDANIALLASALLFALPNGKGCRLLDWDSAKTVPWHVLILFGGGLALAKGFATSGLSTEIGQALSTAHQLPLWLLIPMLCLAVTFVTEVTSNTATTSLLLPILAATAVAASMEPALLLVPAAMSASCAFMLPVATAPNAVVYGSGHIGLSQMARKGFALNLIGVGVISVVALLVLPR